MLIHIVCFKYKAGVDATTGQEHRDRLRALADLDGIVELKVGADIMRAARSYDTGLVATFRDRAAHDAYQVHPRHVELAQFVVPKCEHIVAVDFNE